MPASPVELGDGKFEVRELSIWVGSRRRKEVTEYTGG
jgi:hypothetical protein